ncbi:hypothetical protein MYX04_09090 [Nitrospiraceae bacterium AH_259_D15_M11_P09]|nr:hypothetical protein [Nitrospiraceae bacterium AH_259_D15_M11_P09]
MESDSPMAEAVTEKDLLIGEEVRAKLSPLAADLNRISDRLMEISALAEGAGEDHHQACECAEGELDHAAFLLPDFPEKTQAGTDAEGKSGADPSEDGESEVSLARLPQVLDECLRHLSRMEKGMDKMVASGREVGELGCELLRCERDVRALIERCASESSPHANSLPAGEREA